MTTLPPDLFVLQQQNEKYLTGESEHIASSDGPPLAGFFIALVLLGLGCYGLWSVSESWLTWHMLKRDGITAQATILDLRQDKDDDGDVISHVRYRLEIQTPHGPETYERDGFASLTHFARLQNGGHITIMYSASNPAFSRIINETSGTPPTWELIPCAIAIGLGVFLAVRAHRLRILLNRGRLLPGKVRRCTSLTNEDGFLVCVDYGFWSPGGKLVEGSTRAHRDDLSSGPLPKIGTAVAVLFVDESNHQVL